MENTDKPPPEGAEVKITVDYLNQVTKDKIITGCFLTSTLISKKYLSKWNLSILDKMIYDHEPIGLNQSQTLTKQNFTVTFDCHGKFIWAHFKSTSKDDQFWMMCSLGMSGSWTLTCKKHNHFYFLICNKEYVPVAQLSQNHQHLYFNDPRKFGNIKFVNSLNPITKKINEMGIDPLSNKIVHTNDIISRFRKYNYLNICEALMNQKIIAGVGNYVKCEAMYRFPTNPFCKVHNLNDSQLINLYRECCLVLQESYKQQGASFKTFEHGDGSKGNFSNFFRIYRKKETLNNELVYKATTPDGRTTHYTQRQLDSYIGSNDYVAST